MKRAALFAVLLVIGPALRLQAQVTCLNKDKCGPLPCEFMSELLLAKLRARDFTSQVQSNSQKLGELLAATTDPRALDGRIDSLKKSQDKNFRDFQKEESEAIRKVWPEYFQCSREIDVSPKPTCEGLADKSQAGSRCNEIVGATLAQQTVCDRPPSPGETLADRALDAEQAKIDALKSSLSQYLNSCAPNPDQAMQLSAAGLGPLLQTSKIVRENWKAGRVAPSQNPAYNPADVFTGP